MDARIDQPSSTPDQLAALRRVMGDWSGVGTLFRAFAELADEAESDRTWSVSDVRRRAMRVLLLQCAPALSTWPRTTGQWAQHVQVGSSRSRYWSTTPSSGVRWAETRRRGWPPSEFRVSQRRRAADQLTTSVLSWTIRELVVALDESARLVGPAAYGVKPLESEARQAVLASAPLLESLNQVDSTRPNADDLRAVAKLGWPWKPVAEVARTLLSLHRRGLEELAQYLLTPDGFPEVLLQLETLGRLLILLEEAGARITSLRPIAYMTSGAVYQATWPDGRKWDVWCEAAAAWSTYGATDTYRELSSILRAGNVEDEKFRGGNLRPDILLVEPGRFVSVLECKYSSTDAGYVASGLPQAYFYAAQFASVFESVDAWVVGPGRFVPQSDVSNVGEIRLGITNAQMLEPVLEGRLIGVGA